jgi:hypothetical protein
VGEVTTGGACVIGGIAGGAGAGWLGYLLGSWAGEATYDFVTDFQWYAVDEHQRAALSGCDQGRPDNGLAHAGWSNEYTDIVCQELAEGCLLDTGQRTVNSTRRGCPCSLRSCRSSRIPCSERHFVTSETSPRGRAR